MTAALDRDALLDAFDRIGYAAIEARTRLQIAVYGGSALMLASNFRFATEDVDIADIGRAWPDWLTKVVAAIAREKEWSEDWLNDAVTFHLSPLAQLHRDHLPFGTFPRQSEAVGLTVFIPTARYLLAMKLKSLRISDFKKGAVDMADTAHLLHVIGITEVEQAIAVLDEFFPRSAADADKQRFVLKRLLSQDTPIDAPKYPGRSDEEN
ncbi:MAG: hypothetical protein QOJ86_1825 [Bradyrhizobium sp.]|jgi:hypothetical protein|nr:hypothetical protein [Bradyrhizobium sp.]